MNSYHDSDLRRLKPYMKRYEGFNLNFSKHFWQQWQQSVVEQLLRPLSLFRTLTKPFRFLLSHFWQSKTQQTKNSLESTPPSKYFSPFCVADRWLWQHVCWTLNTPFCVDACPGRLVKVDDETNTDEWRTFSFTVHESQSPLNDKNKVMISITNQKEQFNRKAVGELAEYIISMTFERRNCCTIVSIAFQ